LFDRTSRRVALTAAGETLLPRARRLLLLHGETVRELRGGETTLLVNVVASGLTPARVLAAARSREPATEFFARFEGGMSGATSLLREHRLDATFGSARGDERVRRAADPLGTDGVAGAGSQPAGPAVRGAAVCPTGCPGVLAGWGPPAP
jgi:DNA-binding transcriptional LysR family regulator